MTRNIAIESPLPAALAPGRPTALFLQGRAVGVRRLELLVGGEAHRAAGTRMPRSDLGARAGWWAVVPVPGREDGATGDVAARADGEHVALATLPVRALPAAPASGAEHAEPLIAVCMATYEPDAELF